MVTEITREELRQKLEDPKRFVLLEALLPEQYRQSIFREHSTCLPTRSKLSHPN